MAIKERESYEANHRRADAERRVQELIAENERLQEEPPRAENGRLNRRAQLAEERAEGLETQWVVHREDDHNDRETARWGRMGGRQSGQVPRNRGGSQDTVRAAQIRLLPTRVYS